MSTIREKLAAVHEQEDDYAEAAKVLQGIPLDSGHRYVPVPCGIVIVGRWHKFYQSLFCVALLVLSLTIINSASTSASCACSSRKTRPSALRHT